MAKQTSRVSSDFNIPHAYPVMSQRRSQVGDRVSIYHGGDRFEEGRLLEIHPDLDLYTVETKSGTYTVTGNKVK